MCNQEFQFVPTGAGVPVVRLDFNVEFDCHYGPRLDGPPKVVGKTAAGIFVVTEWDFKTSISDSTWKVCSAEDCAKAKAGCKNCLQWDFTLKVHLYEIRKMHTPLILLFVIIPWDVERTYDRGVLEQQYTTKCCCCDQPPSFAPDH